MIMVMIENTIVKTTKLKAESRVSISIFRFVAEYRGRVSRNTEIRNTISPELQQPRRESTRPSPTRYGRPRTRQSSSAPRPRRPVSGRRSTSTRTIGPWNRATPTSTRPTSRTRRTPIEDSFPTPRPRPVWAPPRTGSRWKLGEGPRICPITCGQRPWRTVSRDSTR